MKAVVLAGGLGTRLHPLTISVPKPMVPVLNRPIMSYTVELLCRHNLKDVKALLYHQPDVIKNYFRDGSDFGVKMSYVEADKDLGTAGAVRLASDGKEPLLVISADLITDVDLSAAIAFHKKMRSQATIILTRVSNPLQYGIVITDKKGRVKKFLEKPSWSEVFSDTINAGIYILEPAVVELIPRDRPFDFSQDLFPLLLKKRKRLYGFIAGGYWEDIGKLDDYSKASRELLSGAGKFKPEGKKLPNSNIWVGEGAVISSKADLQGMGVIGGGTIVSDGAMLVDSTVGRGCKIGRGAYIRESILWDGAEVGAEARIERAVVGKRSKIGERSVIDEGVIIADGVLVEKDAQIKPYIKIWPGKVIEEGSVVSRSIVWRERWSKSLFGPYGITGICNVEITPEFAASVGAAYGSMLGKGTTITCSRDSHKASRMIYRALLSGVLSAGVNVSDLEMVPIPVNRYELRSLKSSGGFHVRKSPYDNEVIDIKFFDSNGMDIDSTKEKKVERLFFAENFLRTGVDENGEITFPFHRVAEAYKEGILNYLKKGEMKSCNLKVVIDYAFGAASQIFPSILGGLGLDVISINAHIDETKITKNKAQFDRSLDQLSQIVKSLNADLGIMLDTGGEKIFLCDERGNILDGSKVLGLMALTVLRGKKGAVIAVPVKESRVMEEIAKKYKGEVMRTKTSQRGMMEAAAQSKVAFLGEGLGGFIFPDFMPTFDGMLSACKLMESLCHNKVALSDLASEVPQIKVLKREVSCSPDQKGKVMRVLVEGPEADRVELIDGVKLWFGGDWILVLPDPMHPVIHLYAEAGTDKNAQLLLSRYISKIDSLKED